MMTNFILKHYYDQIIVPLQKEYAILERKMRSRKITDLLLRSVYRDRLQFYRQLLLEQYKKLGDMVREEAEFRADLRKQYPMLWDQDTTEK